MFKYRAVLYQLIGNAKDGYEVNDACNSDYVIEFKDYQFGDKDIIRELKNCGLLNKNLKNKSIDIEGNENTLYVNYVTNRLGRYPICELRREA